MHASRLLLSVEKRWRVTESGLSIPQAFEGGAAEEKAVSFAHGNV
jgi:hypothetical protein